MIGFLCALLFFLAPLSWGGLSVVSGLAMAQPIPSATLFAELGSAISDASPSDSPDSVSFESQRSRATSKVQLSEVKPSEVKSPEATVMPDADGVLSPEQALERLFVTDSIQPTWFVSAFLQQISLPQIQDVLTQISANFGEVQSIRTTENGYAIQFAKATVPAQLRLTADGQIAGLFFEPPQIPIPLEEAIAILETAPYTTGVLVTKDGSDLTAINPDMPVAVASAFKLAVLAALKNQIDAGILSWDTVVELQPEWKSLPSGMIQDWPDGSLVTIDTLATLMIVISDNTAADALIQIMGREAVENLAPRNQPFLTTKEVFILSDTANVNWLKRYQDGNTAMRQQVISELRDRPLPDKNLLASAPGNLDAEWWFTPRELCHLIETVADLPAMHINPGVADRNAWKQVAFKGGSAPGVFNLTTWLQNQQGQSYCVAATWNSAQQPLNEDGVTEIYQGLIIGLEQE